MKEPYRERTPEGHVIIVGPSSERSLSVGNAVHYRLADRITSVAYHFRTLEVMLKLEQGSENSPLSVQLLSTHIPSDTGADNMDRIEITLQALQKTRRGRRTMTIVGADVDAELRGAGPLVGGALRRRVGGEQRQQRRQAHEGDNEHTAESEGEGQIRPRRVREPDRDDTLQGDGKGEQPPRGQAQDGDNDDDNAEAEEGPRVRPQPVRVPDHDEG